VEALKSLGQPSIELLKAVLNLVGKISLNNTAWFLTVISTLAGDIICVI